MLLAAVAACCNADELPGCFAAEVDAHVLGQFALYGPLSRNREYFGYIYLHQGVIASAVSAGGLCKWTVRCEVSTPEAAASIPGGARVLGEWHTHPHSSGSRSLSAADVRGAHANRHIRCYRAFFSRSNGEIVAWSPDASEVKMAMASLVRLGNYRRNGR